MRFSGVQKGERSCRKRVREGAVFRWMGKRRESLAKWNRGRESEGRVKGSNREKGRGLESDGRYE